jgi:hypothetical protein
MKFRPLEWIRKFYNLPDTPELRWERTETYRRRMEQVKTGWILMGLVMLAVDHNATVFAMAVFSMCLTFAFLEQDDQFSE